MESSSKTAGSVLADGSDRLLSSLQRDVHSARPFDVRPSLRVEGTEQSIMHKRFPPIIGRIKIPVSSREAALKAAAIYAPVGRVRPWIHSLSLAYLKLLGPKWLPGKTRPWSVAMDAKVWEKLNGKLQGICGAYDDCAVYERRQKTRLGFGMLLFREGADIAFVRVNHNRHARVRLEHEALRLLQRSLPSVFNAPKPLGVGALMEWAYLATTVVLSGQHRPAIDAPIEDITAEIQSALKELPRTPDIPDHWVPMHGDLTPWNLRAGEQGLVLYDWEHVGWGPPGADETMYRATSAVLSGDRASLTSWPEARAFWLQRIADSALGNYKLERHRAALRQLLT
jgi:hypothetical protein